MSVLQRERSFAGSAAVPGDERLQRLLLTVIALAGVALYLAHTLYFRSLFHGNAVDDAYISFRYAEHLMQGRGLVFNPGERVEGYSNLLWILLLAPVARAGIDIVLAAHVLSIACGVLSILVAVWALRRSFGERSLALAALLVLMLAGSGYFAAWSIGGLEGIFYGLLLLAAWWRFTVEMQEPERRAPFSALLLAAVVLTRPEGVFVALGAVALRFVLAARSGRLLAREALLFAGIVLGSVVAYEVWRFAYYGPHLLPTSVRAKVGGGSGSLGRGLGYVGSNFLVPYLPLAASVAIVGRRARRLDFATGYALVLGYLIFVAAVGGDWAWGRLFAPILPLGSLLFAAALGARLRARDAGPNRSPAAPDPAPGARPAGRSPHAAASNAPAAILEVPGRRLAAMVLGLAFLYAGYAFVVTSLLREQKLWSIWAPVDAERIAIGKFLAEKMPPDAVVAVYAAGEIPYYSRLRAHDMLGLNEPYIASLRMPNMGRGNAGHEKYDPAYTLEKVRPDIIIDAQLIPGMHRHPLWHREYLPVNAFWHYEEVAMRRDLLERLRQSGRMSG